MESESLRYRYEGGGRGRRMLLYLEKVLSLTLYLNSLFSLLFLPPSLPPSLPPPSSLLPPLQWSHTNHDKLLSVMHKEDKKEFGFDIRDLDWDQYIKDYCLGTKQYLFNEDLTNVPIARRQIKR